jgi:hypothetical protein
MLDATQFDDQQALAPYLLPSERILWCGRPPTGFLFRKSDAFLIPFSLLWAGFAVFWEYMAYAQGAPTFFLLFGAVFVLIGVFFTVGRFYYDMRVRENTVYAVTDSRALILAGFARQSLTALTLKSLSQIGLELSGGGRGTISFGGPSPMGSIVRNPSWPGTGRYSPPIFERIDNAAEVYRLLQPSSRE